MATDQPLRIEDKLYQNRYLVDAGRARVLGERDRTGPDRLAVRARHHRGALHVQGPRAPELGEHLDGAGAGCVVHASVPRRSNTGVFTSGAACQLSGVNAGVEPGDGTGGVATEGADEGVAQEAA